jgi:hypothetical protein
MYSRMSVNTLTVLVFAVSTAGALASRIEQPFYRNNLLISPAPNTNTSQAIWNVFTYIQADNNLSDFALYDIQEMAEVGSTPDVHIIVQHDKPNDIGTWRYKIEKNAIEVVDFLSYEMGQKPGKELVEGMHWNIKNYPAQHYALNLWNHGSGVTDPKRHDWLRGILFDDSQGTYLDNQALTSSMRDIATLIGHKLDLLGMDACFMQMVEIGYQIKDYVEILVGSEDVEPGDGWYYTGFLAALVANPLTPVQLAKEIVDSYDMFYRPITPYYTQSAVDLNYMDALAKNIDKVIDGIETCAQSNYHSVLRAVNAARSRSLSFEDDDFIDLYSFYEKLEAQLLSLKKRGGNEQTIKPKPAWVYQQASSNKKAISTPSLRKHIDATCATLREGKDLIAKAVIVSAAGSGMQSARGISIYYPVYGIDSSYTNTAFAQQTKWYTRFLKGFLRLPIW